MNETTPISEQIDAVADRFEAAWNAGGEPSIERFLEDCLPAERLHLLAELIRIDAAYRRRQGRRPDLVQYLASFPQLAGQEEIVRQLDDYLHGLSTLEAGVTPSDFRCAVTGKVDHSLPLRISRFTLLEELGDGAFGKVFRAHDEHLDRQVAVKVLRGAAFAGAEERARFLREARSVAQLRHESIVSVHEAGEHDGVPYIVSELIAGTTLEAAIANRGIGHRQAAELIALIARALDYAHQQQIIHRDIKPSNILVDSAGRPFITDFGLAKRSVAEVGMTADGQVLGTPAYMSPEQAAGRIDQIDARSDVYSLGVVLYELLTGERPFRGDLRMLLIQVQSDEPRLPRTLDDRIPRDLETICLKAMSKERSQRYQTAGALADDLNRFLRGEPIHARPVSSWTRAVRFSRRHWKVLAPTLAAAIAAVMVGVLLIVNAQTQARERRREALVERLQRLRLRERANAWSDVADGLIREAAAIRRPARFCRGLTGRLGCQARETF